MVSVSILFNQIFDIFLIYASAVCVYPQQRVLFAMVKFDFCEILLLFRNDGDGWDVDLIGMFSTQVRS